MTRKMKIIEDLKYDFRGYLGVEWIARLDKMVNKMFSLMDENKALKEQNRILKENLELMKAAKKLQDDVSVSPYPGAKEFMDLFGGKK